MSHVLIPKQIVDIRPGPVVEGMQHLTTIAMKMPGGALLEIAIPTYLLASGNVVDSWPKMTSNEVA